MTGWHQPFISWSKKTQLRFQAKLYTYTPKVGQRISKEERSERLEKNEFDVVQVLETSDVAKKVEEGEPELKHEEDQEPFS